MRATDQTCATLFTQLNTVMNNSAGFKSTLSYLSIKPCEATNRGVAAPGGEGHTLSRTIICLYLDDSASWFHDSCLINVHATTRSRTNTSQRMWLLQGHMLWPILLQNASCHSYIYVHASTDSGSESCQSGSMHIRVSTGIRPHTYMPHTSPAQHMLLSGCALCPRWTLYWYCCYFYCRCCLAWVWLLRA